MAFIIGTDEAGYGPNLGPLVISATVWEVPNGLVPEDLYQRLASVVSPTPLRAAAQDGHVAIADSKLLYQSGGGMRNLERGLGAALAALGTRPTRWSEAWETLAPADLRALRAAPWFAEFDRRLPLTGTADELDKLGKSLLAAFEKSDVWLLEMASRAVFPEEFNRMVEQCDSKGDALSRLTMELVRKVSNDLDGGPILVLCDKHGGRNRYAPLLSTHFTDGLVETRAEGRQQSVYRFGPPRRRMEFRFTMQAEAYLPVALASMASKYLRELAMHAFNDFWRDQVPGLKPTAGYPLDARRFKEEIAAAQKSLGVDDRILWRVK